MTLFSRCVCLSRGALLLLLLTASALAPAPALAMVAPRSDGALSPALAELAKPAVRSKSPARQAAILGVAASGPGSLQRQGGRVLVNLRFEAGAISHLAALEATGSRVLGASRRLQTATLAVDPGALGRVAAVSGVASVTPSLAPLVFGRASASGSGPGSCEGGAVISEGVGQLEVDKAREEFGLRGLGVTVGILSDSFDTATEAADESGPVATHVHEDVRSNDLPGAAGTCSGQQVPVDVLEDDASGEGGDEGRAMLQIVHDVAPHASLAFATAFKSEESFARNIERLAEPTAAGGADAKVIVDDVSYFEEPFFQNGPVAAAVEKVTDEGATYLSAAGNNNLFDAGEREISSWEAPAYRNAGSCPTAVEALSGFKGTRCMDFVPGGGVDPTFGITVAPNTTLTVDLQWDEPWYGVGTDFDAFLLNSGNELIAKSSAENSGKNGTQKPLEIIQWTNKGSAAEVNLAINRYSGSASPRLKFALLENGAGVTETEYPESSGGDVVGPTIFGHPGAAAAITVGAVRYNNGASPERFSSRGPVTHYFGPVLGITEAPALGAPETVAKPNLVATDCGATTFFAQLVSSVWRFCGTSAAAPHAAGVAALLLQAEPGASVQQVRESLTETAVPVGAFGPDAVGSGLIDATAAVANLPNEMAVEDGPSTLVPALEPEPELNPTPRPVDPATPATPATPAPDPTTVLRWHPPRIVRTRGLTARVVFRFGSDQEPATFLCRLDRGSFQTCGSGFARRFALGPHVVRVEARNAAGLLDATPAAFSFRVKQVG